MKKKFYNVEETNHDECIAGIVVCTIVIFLLALIIGKNYYDSKIKYSAISDIKKCTVYDTDWEHDPRSTKVYAVCESQFKTFKIPGWVTESHFENSVPYSSTYNEGWDDGYKSARDFCETEKVGAETKGIRKGMYEGAEVMLQCIKNNGKKVCEKRLNNLKEITK